MRWQLVDVTKGSPEEHECTRHCMIEVFSVEHCDIEAFIPPDKVLSIYYLSSNDLAFKTRAPLLVGEEYPISISFAQKKHKGQRDSITVPIFIVADGKAPENYLLYRAEFSRSAENKLESFFNFLTSLLDKDSGDAKGTFEDHERRQNLRILRALSVVSKDLDGFKAITSDISTGGIKLIMTGGEISIGDNIRLRLDLDDYFTDPMYVKAVVRRVEHSDDDNLSVGVEFVDLNERQQEIINKYIQDVIEREKRYKF